METTPRKRPCFRMTPDRNRDFLNLCRRIIKESTTPLTLHQLADKAVHHPAPGYYADYDYAVHIIPRVMKMPREEAERRCHGRWLEIGLRARSLVNTGVVADLSKGIAHVLNHGIASRFFISVATGVRILNSVDK